MAPPQNITSKIRHPSDGVRARWKKSNHRHQLSRIIFLRLTLERISVQKMVMQGRRKKTSYHGRKVKLEHKSLCWSFQSVAAGIDLHEPEIVKQQADDMLAHN